MAEIRVEPKRRSMAWLWVLLALALVALVFWYLNNDGVNQVDTVPATSALPTAPTLVAPLALAAPDARVA
jgi:hypothetical protein